MDTSRRSLLGASAGLASALALFTTSQAQACDPDAASKAFSDLLEDAVRSGNLEAAISAHAEAAHLNATQLKSLRALTPTDLKNLQDVRGKLLKVTEGSSVSWVTSW